MWVLPISTTRTASSHLFKQHLRIPPMSVQSNVALAPQRNAAPEAGTLFSPYRLGTLQLSNRLVMAPMTRSRALAGNVPNPLAATYYAQRASAGLIVTEASQVSPEG